MQHAVPSVHDDVARARARVERVDRWSGSWRIALLGALAFGYTAFGFVGAVERVIDGDVSGFMVLCGTAAAFAAVGWAIRVSRVRSLDGLESLVVVMCGSWSVLVAAVIAICVATGAWRA